MRLDLEINTAKYYDSYNSRGVAVKYDGQQRKKSSCVQFTI